MIGDSNTSRPGKCYEKNLAIATFQFNHFIVNVRKISITLPFPLPLPLPLPLPYLAIATMININYLAIARRKAPLCIPTNSSRPSLEIHHQECEVEVVMVLTMLARMV